MRSFWSSVGRHAGRRAGLVSSIGLVLTLILGVGLTALHFRTDTSSYLNAGDRVYTDDVRYEATFGGQAELVLVSARPGNKVPDLLTLANLDRFRAFGAELRSHSDLVAGVVTPVEVLTLAQNLSSHTPSGAPTATPAESVIGKATSYAISRSNSADAAKRLAAAQQTLARISAIPGPHDLTNPAWIRFLATTNDGHVRPSQHTTFPSDTTIEVVVRLQSNQSIDQQAASARLVQRVASKYHFDGAAPAIATGSPALLKHINDYLRGGLLTLTSIAVAAMLLILLLAFRVRWRLLPLAVVGVGLVWAFGLVGFLGLPLTIATIAGVPTLLGVGIDYAIQMQARVEEEALVRRHPQPIEETARNLCPALVLVALDAVFAFVALEFAKVPMIRQFGLILVIGIAVICLVSIVGPLAALGAREHRSPARSHPSGSPSDPSPSNRLGRLVVAMSHTPKWLAVPLTLVSLAVFAGGVSVENRLHLQTDPAEWVNPNSAVIRDINTVRAATGSSNEMGVVVQATGAPGTPATAFDDQLVAYVDRLTTTQLAKHPDELASASSVVEVMGDSMNDVPGTARISPPASLVRAAYDAEPLDIRRQHVAADQRGLNVVFLTVQPNLQQVKNVVDQVRALPAQPEDGKSLRPPAGVTVYPSGLAVVGVGLLENLASNRVLLTYLSIAFVAGFLALRLRSAARALLSMVPVLIATGAAALAAWGFGLELSPLTAVGGPLVVAACTEFTSLLLLRFIEERARGHSPRHAMDVTASRTGRAFLVSAATAVAGIAVMATSSMPLLRDFGLLVGLNVAVALLAALVVLPPILVWADGPGGGWVSRGIVPRLQRAKEKENRALGPELAPRQREGDEQPVAAR